MTEEIVPAAGETPAEPVAAPPPKRQRGIALPWILNGLGFVILAAGIVYVGQNPAVPPALPGQAADTQIAALEARLAKLEQRPAADVMPLTGKIEALEGKLADQSQSAARLDALSGRIESLSGRSQSGIDATKQQADELAARVAALEANAAGIEATGKRLTRIAKLQAASFALEAGRPLGDLPDAPAALTRFAHAAPPTETQLRRLFDTAEKIALAAKQPDRSDAPFLDRMLERAEALVTIRRGNEIVVGDPLAVALNNARNALEAGNIGGAADAVQTLKGQPAEAMAEWLDGARALLNARAALAELAGRA
jgi:hypothetical protein